MVSNLTTVLFQEGPPWWDYPGFELWKFLNLAIFLGVLIYLHRVFGRPIANALRERKEQIARTLVEAREQRERAQATLADVEARISNLEAEIEAIRQRATAEAAAESARIRQQ